MNVPDFTTQMRQYRPLYARQYSKDGLVVPPRSIHLKYIKREAAPPGDAASQPERHYNVTASVPALPGTSVAMALILTRNLIATRIKFLQQ
jgi:hypothetical protein